MKGSTRNYLVLIACLGLSLIPLAGAAPAEAENAGTDPCPEGEECLCPLDLNTWVLQPEEAINECRELVLH